MQTTGIWYWYYISDILECSSGPCKNGATCEDKVNGYQCVCDTGYSGEQCEKGKVED